MKRFALSILILLSICAYGNAECRRNKLSRADKISAVMQNPKSDYVVVVAHRGDWRHAPENSIPAIEGVIAMEADVVELDVHRTKDGVLVLSHDSNIERCTDGKGKISEMTYDEIKDYHLKDHKGNVVDTLHILTLRDALLCCKDRICVNLDKGYGYYDEILAITEELGVTKQVLIKSGIKVQKADSTMACHKNNMLFMPVVSIQKESHRKMVNDYLAGNVPIAFEICLNTWEDGYFETYADKVIKAKSKVWVNTLWPSISGGKGTDDKTAWGGDTPAGPDAVYGRLLDHGVSMIQTDNPAELIQWLKTKGRHTLK